MLKAERQDRIVEMCRVRGTVSVHEIATTLGVSDMTVRRDLEELSEEGRIERLRGGAKTSEGVRDRALIRESAHLERQLLHIEEKTKIAKAAASLVSEDDTIFLGSSTTVEMAAQFLPVIPLRIVTNSLPIFNLFVDGDIREIIMLGGTYRPRSGTFMGPITENALSSLGFDKAFIGVDALRDGQLFTSTLDAGRLYSTVFDHATECFVLADSSKIGSRGFYSFYSLKPNDTVICDDGVDPEELKDLRTYARVLL